MSHLKNIFFKTSTFFPKISDENLETLLSSKEHNVMRRIISDKKKKNLKHPNL